MNDDDDRTNFGNCCACRQPIPPTSQKNYILIGKKAPVPGTGWGCAQCGLAADGAAIVICDDCLKEERVIQDAIYGYAAEGMRIPIHLLTGKHEHDMSKHPEEAKT